MSITSLLFHTPKPSLAEEFLNLRAPIRSVPVNLQEKLTPIVDQEHAFLDVGSGKPIIFSHGLFGGIYNIDKVVPLITKQYRFIMPYLPMYDMTLKECTINQLGDYLKSFIDHLKIPEAVVIGSSMGGGAALSYACRHNHKLRGLVLCGSSGLSAIPLSKGFFKRKNFDFVKESTQDIFFNRSVPTDEMVGDVFSAIQDYEIVLRSIRFTKAATNLMMHEDLPHVHVPTLLVWGRQDPITPVQVAPQFQQLLPDAELCVLEECGHVPTQEKPIEFMERLSEFLKKINY